MSIELKIKSKHLAAEAQIIKAEATKLKKRARIAREKQNADLARKLSWKAEDIKHHNKTVVRCEARATFLARAFIKGVPYKVVEASCVSRMDLRILNRTLAMVQKYGNRSTVLKDLEAWIAVE